jgi:hypothetical protein
VLAEAEREVLSDRLGPAHERLDAVVLEPRAEIVASLRANDVVLVDVVVMDGRASPPG